MWRAQLVHRPGELRTANLGTFVPLEQEAAYAGPLLHKPISGPTRESRGVTLGDWGWIPSEMGGPRLQLQTIVNLRKHKEIINRNAYHDIWLR